MFRIFNHPCNYSLSEETKKFLRPKDYDGPKTVEHNWVDWYCYSNATIIRIYGFEDTPFIPPKIVPDRIACLEIVRQLDFSNVMHLRSFEK